MALEVYACTIARNVKRNATPEGRAYRPNMMVEMTAGRRRLEGVRVMRHEAIYLHVCRDKAAVRITI